jgi:uncharacterized protein (DUF1697 family)
MAKYVAFMRAINVAGHAIVRMSDLQNTFVSAGCRGVRTYIQSGNVIFESPDAAESASFQRIRMKIRELIGDDSAVLFRTVRELERILNSAPFKAYEHEPGIKLYVTFLSEKPRSKPRFPLRSTKEALDAIAIKNLEVFVVSRRKRNGFYGFPNNFVEKELGVSATTRNWSTLTKIVAFTTKTPAA